MIFLLKWRDCCVVKIKYTLTFRDSFFFFFAPHTDRHDPIENCFVCNKTDHRTISTMYRTCVMQLPSGIILTSVCVRACTQFPTHRTLRNTSSRAQRVLFYVRLIKSEGKLYNRVHVMEKK